tara:strand:+ start:988 stop:1125 length:138 start_codon:yes stop_codon:yes gene_type:complete
VEAVVVVRAVKAVLALYVLLGCKEKRWLIIPHIKKLMEIPLKMVS